MPNPKVLQPPASTDALRHGFNQLAELLATSLGPRRGIILASEAGKPLPEVLSDAGTVARRVLALPDRAESVGAMILRNMVWRVRQRVGDGGAITAVLASALLNQAARSISAGANPMILQQGIRQAGQLVLDMLTEMADPVISESDLEAIAANITGDPDLGFVLGELFSILGEHAHITIEDYVAPYLDREYLDGGRWEARLVSPHLVNEPIEKRAILQNCRVALIGWEISSTEEVAAIVEAAVSSQAERLLIVGREVSSTATNALVANHVQGKLKIAAVTLARKGDAERVDFEDLAVLTGANLISPELGTAIVKIRPQDLGLARRIEAKSDNLIVCGGHGSPAAVRELIERLDGQLRRLVFDDDQRASLQKRLARLSGTVAALKIGTLTKTERQALHQRAEQGITALRAAIRSGVVPGGGVAYLHCVRQLPASLLLEKMPSSANAEDLQAGYRAIQVALQAPFRRILMNARVASPGYWMEEILLHGPEMVFDVRTGCLAPARQTGILDPVQVLQVALETAISGSAMALTTGTVILRRKPEFSYEP